MYVGGKKMKNKIITIGILGVFLLSITALPSIGMKTVSLPDPSITVEPAEPDGNFEWYVSPVRVTFHAEDDIRLGYIYYKVVTEGMEEPEWTMVDVLDEWISQYDLSIIIHWDGKHTAHFYAEDHVHNIGPVHTSDRIQIDMTSPEVALAKEKVGLGLIEIKFTATVSDAMSGVYVTKFYIDNSPEPVFERVELTTVEFIWSKIEHGGENIKAEVVDIAGNTESITMSTTISRNRIYPLFRNPFIIRILQRFI
jgi:hypothetical protein